MKDRQERYHKVLAESFIINLGQRIGQCPICGDKIRNFDEAIKHTFKFFKKKQ